MIRPGKKTAVRLILVLFLLLIGAGGWFGVRMYRLRKKNPAADPNSEFDRTFTLKRDNLIIGLRQGGTVNASKKNKLSLQANYRTKLLWVIEENARVKAGTVLAKFETSELQERIDDIRIDLGNLHNELQIAIEDEKILISTHAANLQSAEDRLAQATDALKKYRRFERRQNRDDLLLNIQTAESNYESAESDYVTTRNTINESGATDEATEKANAKKLSDKQDGLDAKERSLEKAETNLRLFKRYDNPNKLLRLRNEFEQSQLNLRKVRISNQSQRVQKKKSIDNLRAHIKRRTQLLERYESYMPMMQLVAPAEGVVIYGDPDRRWGNPDVKPGIDVNKGQILLTIPEMSNLVVDFELPEQFRSKVRIGDKVILTPDSIRTMKISGAISHIATLPVNQISWDSSSPKIYNSKIKLDRQYGRLVPGMSVQVEIVTKIIPKALFVPIEAVFESNNRFYVYRKNLSGPAEVDVTIGDSNNSMVEIRKGLNEGDVVFLYRPYQPKSSGGK
ncbi:MAG: hypothetical protein PHS41_06245 [Victivallaceae bacterium]|nr:hypothetical protein [Victivallaceae bacterium]